MRQKLSHLTLCFAVFNDYFGFSSMLTVLAPLLFDEGHHPVTLGFLLASYPLMQFFSAPILGGLSDRYGRKPILQLTLFVSMLAYALGGLAVFYHSLAGLFAARLIGGMAAGNVTTAQAAIGDISTLENKAKNMSYLLSAIGMGLVAGAAVGSKLAEISWTAPFVLIALLFLGNFLMALLTLQETHTKGDERGFDFALLQAPTLRPLFIVFFLTSIGINFFMQSGAAFLKLKFDIGVASIGDHYVVLVLGLLIVTMYLARQLFKKFSMKDVLFPAVLGMAIVLIGIVNARPEWFYLLFLLYGAFNGLFNSAIYPLVSNAATQKEQGKAFGILASINSLSQVIAPCVSGFLLVYHPDIPLIFSAVLFIITCAILPRR